MIIKSFNGWINMNIDFTSSTSFNSVKQYSLSTLKLIDMYRISYAYV